MDIIAYLIPVALALGGLGLVAFIWSVKSGQFDDPDGAAHRILNDEDKPLSKRVDVPGGFDDADKM